MNFSTEGLIGLIGGIVMMTGFPILLFGDYFDPQKKLTPLALFAGLLTGLGLLGILTALSLISSRILWTSVGGQ